MKNRSMTSSRAHFLKRILAHDYTHDDCNVHSILYLMVKLFLFDYYLIVCAIIGQ